MASKKKIQVNHVKLSNPKIQIARVEDTIAVAKDYRDIKSRGEISHVLAELEIIKQELLVKWMEVK